MLKKAKIKIKPKYKRKPQAFAAEGVSFMGSISIRDRIIEDNGRLAVHYLHTDTFKTGLIAVFFHQPLARETVTQNALIPAVLRRGSEKFPGIKEISMFLEESYGAVFDCGVAKKGERQLLYFFAEYVEDKYTGGKDTLKRCFSLLGDILFHPLSEGGKSFREDIVMQEKKNLKKLIESRINDKLTYSVERCIEEMCSDEPYGNYEYGHVGDLQGIDGKSLFARYVEVLNFSPVDIYYCGSEKEETVLSMIKEFLPFSSDRVMKLPAVTVKSAPGEAREYNETMDVSQGKLCMGFRTNISDTSEDRYFSMVLCNGILGGGMNSKLFRVVREKESLCYYVMSQMDRFKGILLIAAGIDRSNYRKTVELCLAQLDEIKRGNIEIEEMEQARLMIQTQIRSLTDSQWNITDFFLSQKVAGAEGGFEDFIAGLSSVTREQIQESAKNIVLDTVYFLSKGEE